MKKQNGVILKILGKLYKASGKQGKAIKGLQSMRTSTTPALHVDMRRYPSPAQEHFMNESIELRARGDDDDDDDDESEGLVAALEFANRPVGFTNLTSISNLTDLLKEDDEEESKVESEGAPSELSDEIEPKRRSKTAKPVTKTLTATVPKASATKAAAKTSKSAKAVPLPITGKRKQ